MVEWSALRNLRNNGEEQEALAAIDNGGLNHIWYRNTCRPRDLDFQCRRCGAAATLRYLLARFH
jgi:hypothetical protein